MSAAQTSRRRSQDKASGSPESRRRLPLLREVGPAGLLEPLDDVWGLGRREEGQPAAGVQGLDRIRHLSCGEATPRDVDGVPCSIAGSQPRRGHVGLEQHLHGVAP